MNAEGSGRYLTFELAGELFAVEVERVEVVLETATITRVPKSAAYLKGVINYRGAVIPVADLRLRFGAEAAQADNAAAIVVLRIRYGSEDITIGMLADEVHEVIELAPSQIERPPQIGSKVNDDLVAGIGRHDDRFVVVLDIDEAFKAEPAARAGEMQVDSW
ncbi:MAG TPA: chemotaxis protein CheW [Rectinemataceae bacterium]|nr:chemotaxis protein CheW [Rectinemataceae bacterium]